VERHVIKNLQKPGDIKLIEYKNYKKIKKIGG
jgi:hypothetical protein